MNKKNKIKKYCKLCGYELNYRFTNRFNEDSGEREKEYFCPNLSCVRGCEENGGHQYDKRGYSFWYDTELRCRRCGHIEYGSFY